MLWTRFSDRFPRLAQMLANAVRAGRTGHAYLFAGDNPDRLKECALAWTQARCCTAPDAGQPCGQCQNCRRVESDCYEELQLVVPQSKSRAITVDRVRELEHQLGLSVERGILKVALIHEADCMNPQAQNAFLKTLEEPPRASLILLTTTRPQALLPTIRSRCQQISLLENQRSYERSVTMGVPEILATLRPGAGASTGLGAAAKLLAVLGELRGRASELAKESTDERWADAADSDAKLRKELEQQANAHEVAQYLALREEIVETIETWACQESLRAQGASLEYLPHPELLADGPENTPSEPLPEAAAETCMRAAATFARSIRTNADEALVIHAFCLEATKKVPRTPRR